MEYTREEKIRVDKFIEMATEISRFIEINYRGIGEFMMRLDKPKYNAILNPKEDWGPLGGKEFGDFIDQFTQKIYINYIEFNCITFMYKGRHLTVNRLNVFTTEVLVDLRKYANKIYEECNDIKITTDEFYKFVEIESDLRSKLCDKLDELILGKILKYDSRISSIECFRNIYPELDNFLWMSIDKVLEYMGEPV